MEQGQAIDVLLVLSRCGNTLVIVQLKKIKGMDAEVCKAWSGP